MPGASARLDVDSIDMTSARIPSALLSLFIAGAASAADVRVMISAGFHSAYSELARSQVGMAVTPTSREPVAATALLRFLASPEAAPVVLKQGLTPPMPVNPPK